MGVGASRVAEEPEVWVEDEEEGEGEWVGVPSVLSPGWATFHRLVDWPSLCADLQDVDEQLSRAEDRDESLEDIPREARESVRSAARFEWAYRQDDRFDVRKELKRLNTSFWLTEQLRLDKAQKEDFADAALAASLLDSLQKVSDGLGLRRTETVEESELCYHSACDTCGDRARTGQPWHQRVVFVEADGERSLEDAIRSSNPTTPSQMDYKGMRQGPCGATAKGRACRGRRYGLPASVTRAAKHLLLGLTYARGFPNQPLSVPQILNPMRDGWVDSDCDGEWELVGLEGETRAGEDFTMDGRGPQGYHLVLAGRQEPLTLSPEEFEAWCGWPTEEVVVSGGSVDAAVRLTVLWYRRTTRAGQKDGLHLGPDIRKDFTLSNAPIPGLPLSMTGQLFGATPVRGPTRQCIVKTIPLRSQDSWIEVGLLWEHRREERVATLLGVYRDAQPANIKAVFERYEADLTTRIREWNPLGWRAAVGLLVECARCLRVLHDALIFHGDVKEANFFLARNGAVKIGDFGCSRQLQEEEQLVFPRAHTIGYGSPEHIATAEGVGRGVGLKADVWALGVMAFLALSGRRPFTANESAKERWNIKRAEECETEDLEAAVPYYLVSGAEGRRAQALLRKLFVPDPARRPDAQRLIDILRDA